MTSFRFSARSVDRNEGAEVTTVLDLEDFAADVALLTIVKDIIFITCLGDKWV